MAHNSKILVQKSKIRLKSQHFGSNCRNFCSKTVKCKNQKWPWRPYDSISEFKSPKYGPIFDPIWNKFGKICISRFLFPKIQISQYPYGVNDVLMGHIWWIVRVSEIKDIKTILNIDLYWFRRRLETDIKVYLGCSCS